MARREFPASVRKAAWARADGVCECGCGQKFTDHPKERPHYDHILPDYLGGTPTLENCAVTRNRDRLDFHDVAVWAIRAALEEAFEAGRSTATQP